GLALVLGAVACGSAGSGASSCVPGASTACACSNGESGAQVCASDGKAFGACSCNGTNVINPGDNDASSEAGSAGFIGVWICNLAVTAPFTNDGGAATSPTPFTLNAALTGNSLSIYSTPPTPS